MLNLIKELRGRNMMRSARGTGDSFGAPIVVPDELCQRAADVIEGLEAFRDSAMYEMAHLRNEIEGLRRELQARDEQYSSMLKCVADNAYLQAPSAILINEVKL